MTNRQLDILIDIISDNIRSSKYKKENIDNLVKEIKKSDNYIQYIAKFKEYVEIQNKIKELSDKSRSVYNELSTISKVNKVMINHYTTDITIVSDKYIDKIINDIMSIDNKEIEKEIVMLKTQGVKDSDLVQQVTKNLLDR